MVSIFKYIFTFIVTRQINLINSIGSYIMIFDLNFNHFMIHITINKHFLILIFTSSSSKLLSITFSFLGSCQSSVIQVYPLLLILQNLLQVRFMCHLSFYQRITYLSYYNILNLLSVPILHIKLTASVNKNSALSPYLFLMKRIEIIHQYLL